MDFANVDIYNLVAFIVMLIIIAFLSNKISTNKHKIYDVVEVNKKRLGDNTEKVSNKKIESGSGGYKFLNGVYSIIVFALCIIALGFAANIMMDLIHYSNRPEILQYFVIHK